MVKIISNDVIQSIAIYVFSSPVPLKKYCRQRFQNWIDCSQIENIEFSEHFFEEIGERVKSIYEAFSKLMGSTYKTPVWYPVLDFSFHLENDSC